jgi:hypothetical protein
MDEVKKVIRDGKVAVLYSPDFGAGWSTWNGGEYNPIDMVFNPDVVAAVLGESGETPAEAAARAFPEAYDGGVSDLEVEWVPVGTRFYIREYDGSESVVIDDGTWLMTA